MKTIGMIGGMSWESTAVYYRLLNEMTKQRLGGLHSAPLLLWSFDFADIERDQRNADWDAATAKMVDAAIHLAAAGADCLIICTNTMHLMADAVSAAVNIPLLHIVDATATSLREANINQPLLLATRHTMEQAFYRQRLSERHQIEAQVPSAPNRTTVHEVIYQELCRGVVQDSSRQQYLEIIEEARSQGADGVILGCTEIGMLVGSQDIDLPLFDSTALHARAAVDFALS